MIKVKFIPLILCCYFFTLANHSSNAQQRDQLLTGARPIGMGETFTAIADDGNSITWNPAGLATLNRYELNAMHANLYGIGLGNNYASVAFPFSHRLAIGAAWTNLSLDDDDIVRLDYRSDIANLSFGGSISSKMSFGASVKYCYTSMDDGGPLGSKASSIGYDAGLLYSLPIQKIEWIKKVNFGFVINDIGGTKIKFNERARDETLYSPNYRFGLAFFPKEKLSIKKLELNNSLISFDIDDRFHFGAETWLMGVLAVRAGLQKDLYDQQDEGLTFAAGTSMRLLNIFQLDYAYNNPPVLPATHLWSISLVRNPAPVKITDIELTNETVYASLYKYYNSVRMGNIVAFNNHDEAIDGVIRASVPGLEQTETREPVRLAAKRLTSIDFSVAFSDKILEIDDSDNRQLKVVLEYKINNEPRVEEVTKNYTLLGRGAITWDDGGKAAAFVTKSDPSVKAFANEALKDLPHYSEFDFGNIYKAACLFNALCLIDFKYKSDPNNLFSSLTKADYVQYPAESLQLRSGDCDDLTVLYASLLEFSGVGTAFLLTDKHITLMFDTGIHVCKWALLPINDDYVIRQRGSLWIPVNVVELDSTFSYGWQKGAEWRRENDETVIFLSDVEDLYKSSLPKELQNCRLDGSTFAKLDESQKLFKLDSTWISHTIQNFIDDLAAKVQSNPDNIELRNKLGIIYAQHDSISRAMEQFTKILQVIPENRNAQINLANTYFMAGEFEKTEALYSKVREQDDQDPGLLLNMAILYETLSIDSPDSLYYQNLAEKSMEQMIFLLDGDDTAALDIIGLSRNDYEISEGKADKKNWLKKKANAIRKFIKDSVQKYMTQRTVKGTRIVRVGIMREKDPDQGYVLWWAEED